AAGEAAHGVAPAGAGEHAAPAGEEHDVAGVLMHHVVDIRYGHLHVGGLDLGPTKHLVFFGVAALLVIGIVQISLRGYREGGVPSGLGAAVEALVVFVRDEIAEKNIGHDGRKFTPLLLSFFFFILVAALLGLLPFSATSTGNLSVTLGLAFISFLAQQWGGISKFGLVHHFMGLVPPGLPKFLLPIMIPVEILSMFTKPFALMVRLFANMLAGHMVITTLLLLIPLMSSISTFLGITMIPISLGLSLFILFLELLVAFIQAYIFTLLSAIFIGMYAHPAH
ncbi:MAG TPA: F0F1 ATP synthase subunit A, partial [Vicinamibacteria bacterium]|nr:F0F1 ATP synthase subunit A [Vicinamibacteria bacterium]